MYPARVILEIGSVPGGAWGLSGLLDPITTEKVYIYIYVRYE